MCSKIWFSFATFHCSNIIQNHVSMKLFSLFHKKKTNKLFEKASSNRWCFLCLVSQIMLVLSNVWFDCRLSSQDRYVEPNFASHKVTTLDNCEQRFRPKWCHVPFFKHIQCHWDYSVTYKFMSYLCQFEYLPVRIK